MAKVKYLVIGTIIDNKGNLIGYNLVDDSPSTLMKSITLEQARKAGNNAEYYNAQYNPKSGELDGVPNYLYNYPKLNLNFKVVANWGITLLAVLQAKDSDDIVGAIVFYGTGVRSHMSLNDLKRKEIQGIKFTNFRLTGDGRIESLDGSPFKVVKMQEKKKHQVYDSTAQALGLQPVQEIEENDGEFENLDELQTISVSCFDNVSESPYASDAEEKLLKAKINLKKVAPYYFSILSAITVKRVQGFGTFGVTENTMYYDVAFVSQLSISEITYILIHEMMHIVMAHSIRFGKRTNHELWNIACDLFINSVIGSNFYIEDANGNKKHCIFGEEELKFPNGGVLKCPNSGIHLETVGKSSLDLAKESPETIYKQLMKENQQQQQQQAPNMMKALISQILNDLQQAEQSIITHKKDIDDAIVELEKKLERMKAMPDITPAMEQGIKITENQLADKIASEQSISKVLTNISIEKNVLSSAITNNKIFKSDLEFVATTLKKDAGVLSQVGTSNANNDIVSDGHTLKDIADMIEHLLDTASQQSQQSGSSNDMQIIDDSNNQQNQNQQGQGQQGQSGQGQSGQGQAGQQQGQSGQQQGQQGQQQGQQGDPSGEGQSEQQQSGQSQGQSGNQSQSGQGGSDPNAIKDIANSKTAYSQGGSDSQGNQQNGQGDNQSGQQGSPNNSQSGQQGNASNGQSGQQGGSSNNQSGRGGSGGNGNNNSDPFGDSQGLETNTVDEMNGDGKTKKGQVKEVTVTYNGQTIKGRVSMDIITNSNKGDEATIERLKQDTKAALSRIKTKIDFDRDKGLLPSGKDCGQGAGLMDREIEFGLSQDVDWRRILKNVCTTKQKTMYSLAHPNPKFLNHSGHNKGRVVASKRPISTQKVVKDIKICIDVSGSVGKAELDFYLSEVANIFKKFPDVSGELIYWSTEIGNVGDFEKLKDICKIQPTTTGGTDVKCVFDYLSGKTAFNGKYEESKLKDIPLVMIITDGYFSNNYSAEYKDRFNRKVVWIIDGDVRHFDAPFGKTVGLK